MSRSHCERRAVFAFLSSLSGSIMRDAGGEIRGIICLALDITDRKRGEEELRKREYFLSESQRLGHIGSWLYDMTDPMVWSEEMYRLFGVSPDTFIPTVESFSRA